jgi:hypothetical protein
MGWAIGIDGGGTGTGAAPAGPSQTVTIRPVVWEPFVPELHVRCPGGAEGDPHAILKMEKPAGELPGVRPAWNGLKKKFRFEDLMGKVYEPNQEIVSGWTQKGTGFEVHASSLLKPNGEAKLVQQMIAEAPARLYAAVGILFDGLKADEEKYKLDRYFKLLNLKIAGYEIPTPESAFNLEDIRGAAGTAAFLDAVNVENDFSRPWKEIEGNLTTTGTVDREFSPWRVPRLVEMRLEMEVEGRMNDAEEPQRKKGVAAIRFGVLHPRAIDIRILNWESSKSP